MPAIRKTVGKLIKTQTKALDNGVVEVVVATNRKDRHGEILDIKGLNVKDYSGVVLWGHDYFSFPIGKSLSIRKTNDGKLVSRAQLAIDEYDFAATAYKLIKGGYVSDVSIGFIPQEYDAENDTWVKSEMVEYSFVSIGANPDAKVTNKALKEIGLTKDEFEAQVRDYMMQMKALEDEEQTTDDENPDEPPEPVANPDGIETKKVAIPAKAGHNVREHLNAIKSLISATENELDAHDQVSESDSKTKTIKKRITLVRAKKTLNSIDHIAELAIGELKKQLKE